MYPYVLCSIFYRGQDMEATWVSTGRWIKEKWYVCTVEYCAAVEKNEILPSATAWVDLEGIMLSEISQTERQHMI